MPNARILVLTSSTGSGHDGRAYAFKQWVEKLYGSEVEVKVEHILEKSSGLINFGVEVYNWIQRYAPWLHNIYWFVAEIFGIFQGSTKISIGAAYYRRVIDAYKPNLLLSVHDSTNRGYFAEAKSILGPRNVVCVTYCGEFSGGFGYSRIWMDRFADLYYSRNEVAQDFAIQCGMPEDKCRVFTNFLHPSIFEKPRLDNEQMRQFRKEVLGLHPDKFTVFLTTGGFGANSHLKNLELIRWFHEDLQAIVVCGRNKEIYEKLKVWQEDHEYFQLYLEGYSQHVPLLMQASDAILTRGGANTSAEALYFGCALIFSGYGGIMPQERLTINYFVDRGAAVCVRSPRQFARLVEEWKDRPEAYRQVKENLAALHVPDHPKPFFDQMAQLALAAAAHNR